jgi:ribonuclease P protein component
MSSKGEGERKGHGWPFKDNRELLGRSGSSNKKNARDRKFSLSSLERLNRQVVKQVFAKGKRFHCEKLTIIYLRSRKQAAGFVASKKVGIAVKRNMAKRRIREAYRMNKDIFKGLQVIFYIQHQLTVKQILKSFKAFQEHV